MNNNRNRNMNGGMNGGMAKAKCVKIVRKEWLNGKRLERERIMKTIC